MQYPHRVGEGQRGRDRHPRVQYLGHRQRPPVPQRLAERPTRAELHGQKGMSVIGESGVIDRDHAGVCTHPAIGGALAAKAGPRRLVHEVDRQHLDCDIPIDGRLPRAIDGGESASPDEREVVIAGNLHHGLPAVRSA